MEKFEGPPKPSLGARVKERLKTVFKKKESPAVPDGSEPEPKASKPEKVDRDTENRLTEKIDFEKALRKLSPKLRDAVRLVHVEGKTVAETAKELGISENGVRARLQNAYRDIRYHMR